MSRDIFSVIQKTKERISSNPLDYAPVRVETYRILRTGTEYQVGRATAPISIAGKVYQAGWFSPIPEPPKPAYIRVRHTKRFDYTGDDKSWHHIKGEATIIGYIRADEKESGLVEDNLNDALVNQVQNDLETGFGQSDLELEYEVMGTEYEDDDRREQYSRIWDYEGNYTTSSGTYRLRGYIIIDEGDLYVPPDFPA